MASQRKNVDTSIRTTRRAESLFHEIDREPEEKPEKKSEEEKKPLLEKLFVSKLNDQEWMCMLAYLADIFGYLNELNLQTQGKRANCFYFWNKIQSFKKKLALWIDHIKNSNFAMFESSDGLLSGNAALINVMKPIILTHLSNLVEKFNEYFAERDDPLLNHLWVVDPFLNTNERNTLTPIEQNELMGKVVFFSFF